MQRGHNPGNACSGWSMLTFPQLDEGIGVCRFQPGPGRSSCRGSEVRDFPQASTGVEAALALR